MVLQTLAGGARAGRRQGGGGVSFKEIQCMKVCVRKGVPLTEGYLFCPKLAVCSLRRGPPCFVITPWITLGNLTRVASPGSSQTSAQLCTYTPPGCHLLTWQVTHPLSTCLASFTKPGYMTPRPSMLSLPLPAPPFLIRQPPLLTLGPGHPWMLASLPVLPLLPHASGLPHTAVTARGPRRACCLLLLPDKGPGFPILHGQSHLHTPALINLSALSTPLS